jgi:hypothetical protein
MSVPAGHFAAAAKTVGDSIAGLDDLSHDLSEISVLLDTVGNALEQLGSALGGTATQARSFMGGAGA